MPYLDQQPKHIHHTYPLARHGCPGDERDVFYLTSIESCIPCVVRNKHHHYISDSSKFGRLVSWMYRKCPHICVNINAECTFKVYEVCIMSAYIPL